jgi:valyl-tRNA synthetase
MSEMKESLQSNSPPQSTLSKTYDPKAVEGQWYEAWEKAGYFKPASQGEPYTIVIPPPNVTGSLHMGHALNSTLQDILIRYEKMNGKAALWVPGTDHGGIATQNVVEKILRDEKTSRHDLGREKFLERMWKWRSDTGDTILMQLRRLGATLDWEKTRFTMDEVCSKAVRQAFVDLYNKKLLYRGKRLVNWCPRCHTALADIEVDHKESNGHLWHIRYPLADRRQKERPQAKKKKTSVFDQGFIEVATTRPETMLGDTAVAVHPKDNRYKDLIDMKVKLPLTGREIPIVADDVVDKTFGSGAVKVTPAHDPTDFDIAGRHNLPHITVIDFEGKMTEDAGKNYTDLDRFEARKKVVEDLEQQGLLTKIEDYKLSVSVCYRCDCIVEPLESEQWFLSMGEMAKKAIEASKKGRIIFVPDSWESPYLLWLKNLKDWCISRQIWWGHRIPVWYCVKKEGDESKRLDYPPIVSMEDPKENPYPEGELEQDPDVLDTWFSSALWPFSVLRWPDEGDDIKRFFPTSTMVTGHEILYLWVARMTMFALQFKNDIPFKTVFIHGIVRDKKGRKMSKSLGNVIDPLDLIKDYGADAVRFALAQSAAPGRDMQVSKDNFTASRNFSNKIWNATRFSLVHLASLKDIPDLAHFKDKWELSDRWILNRLNLVIRSTTEAMKIFDIDAASRGLYDFFWSDLCDWYLEMIKPRFDEAKREEFGFDASSADAAGAVLATVLETVLRLLHPFMPFITEELWQKLPKKAQEKSRHIMATAWPEADPSWDDKEASKQMQVLQEMVTKIRAIRSEMGIPPTQPIDVVAKSSERNTEKLLSDQKIILKCLNSRVQTLKIDPHAARPKASAAAVVPGANLYVPLEGLINFEKERARLEKELAGVKQELERIGKKLNNQDFITHAPPEEVAKAKARLQDAKERAHRLEENISTLS